MMIENIYISGVHATIGTCALNVAVMGVAGSSVRYCRFLPKLRPTR